MHIKHLPPKYKAFFTCWSVWLNGSGEGIFCTKGFCTITVLSWPSQPRYRVGRSGTLVTTASDRSASACQ